MKTDRKILLLLVLWATAVLLFVSIDSPLHDVFNRVDSGWHFMCGKALMNGLTPYVDFADSKGPLLWLIYGIGYLLSPRNFVGVWVLCCLYYGIVLFYNYKTARLLLGDERKALLVAVMMPMVYFLPWFHYEVRAEDWCFLPVSVSLYYLFWLLYGSGGTAAQQTDGGDGQLTVRRCGLVFGCCFMALVLIKYSIAVMQGSIIAFALWHCLWKRDNGGALLRWTLCGMFIVAVPFVVWLSMAGAFSACIDEYFINTFKTVSSDEGFVATLMTEFATQWDTPKSLALLLLMTLGGWLLSRQLTTYRYVPLLVSLFFYLVCTRHNMNYYYSTCYTFLIFLVIYVVGQLRKPIKTWNIVLTMLVVLTWGVSEVVRSSSFKSINTKWAVNEYRDVYERLSYSITGDKPRVLNFYGGEFCFGMEHEPLPAGKYWCKQVDMTPEMIREHEDILKSGNADYVVVYDSKISRRKGYDTKDICGYGFMVCDSLTYVDYKGKLRTTVIYKREDVNGKK